MKPAEEVVTVPVPLLIELEIFETVQNRMKVNDPKVTPPSPTTASSGSTKQSRRVR